MKIIKIGTFDEKGMPTGWHIDLSPQDGVEYCLGIDQLFRGSVDVNRVEITQWTQARKESIIEPASLKPL